MVSGIKIHHRDTQDTGEKHGEKKKKEKTGECQVLQVIQA
jgi:hypothetical protein